MTSHLGIPWCCKYEGRNMEKLGTPYRLWDLEIFRSLPSPSPPVYRLWNLENFRSHLLFIGAGTKKNSKPELPPELWNLQKYRSFPLHISPGAWEKSDLFPSTVYRRWYLKTILSFLLLEQLVGEAPSEARGEVYFFYLLHIGPRTLKNSDPSFI